ncbi:MAG: rhomboid family intramembrane serine protease [Planctomycetota bacterium]|jgi:membrane associated rhomboid family serine protease
MTEPIDAAPAGPPIDTPPKPAVAPKTSRALLTTLIALLLVAIHAYLVYLVARPGRPGQGYWDTALRALPGPVLQSAGALMPGGFSAENAWQLLTSALLHSGLLHLGFNTWALVALGRPIEELFGRGALLSGLFAGAIAGGLAAVYFEGSPVVGASGAILGLAGVLGVGLRGPAFRPDAARRIRRRMLTSVGILIGAGIVWNMIAQRQGFRLQISNASHLGGFLGGALVGAFAHASWAPVSPRRRVSNHVVTVGVVAAGLLLLLPGLRHTYDRLARADLRKGAHWFTATLELRTERLPGMRLAIDLPIDWNLLEKSGQDYCAFGPGEGQPLVQVQRGARLVFAGAPEPFRGLPDRLLRSLEDSLADHYGGEAEFMAAPFRDTTVDSRPAIIMEMRYRKKGSDDPFTQQVRYLVDDPGGRAFQFYFLNPFPEDGEVGPAIAETIMGTVRFEIED